jgi:hypothetical protein
VRYFKVTMILGDRAFEENPPNPYIVKHKVRDMLQYTFRGYIRAVNVKRTTKTIGLDPWKEVNK